MMTEPAPLEVLLDQLTANAVEAGRLASLVQAEAAAQLTRAQKLRDEATEAEQLAALHGPAAEAVAAQFKAAIQNETKKSARWARWTSALYFISGIAASIAVTLFIRPLGAP